MEAGRAGHVWVGRRDCPAAETDATVVRHHFLCQAPPSPGQRQTPALVAGVCFCMCACQQRDTTLFDVVSGSNQGLVVSSTLRPLRWFQRMFLLVLASFHAIHLPNSPSLSLSLSLFSIFPSAAKQTPTAVKRKKGRGRVEVHRNRETRKWEMKKKNS